MTSDDALAMEELPESILIVGGGVIGVEWASMLNDFGVDVTIVEYADRLLPQEDADISRELERLFKKRKIKMHDRREGDAGSGADGKTASRWRSSSEGAARRRSQRTKCSFPSAGRPMWKASAWKIRTCRWNGASSPSMRIHADEGTAYLCDRRCGRRFAARPCRQPRRHTRRWSMLRAGGASRRRRNRFRAASIPGRKSPVVGLTEQQAKERGHEVKDRQILLQSVGKALVYGDTDGFVKVVADAATDDILGVHMIGPHVTDYISEAALAQVLDATPWEVGQTVHPHPTLSEALAKR